MYQKQSSMPARKWTEQYNAKRESMKDCKYFFYQYSEFYVFTRQSSVESYYQRTNYNIMVSSKNDVNPRGHPGPRHTRKTKPSRKNIQRSNGKCCCRTANPKRMKRFRMSEALPGIWKGVPQTGPNLSLSLWPQYMIPTNEPVCIIHRWLPHIGGLIHSTTPIKRCRLRYLIES